MESISVCGKGGSTLKNTTNTTGSLASLHLGFKLSQDVSSDCFLWFVQTFLFVVQDSNTQMLPDLEGQLTLCNSMV